MNKYDTTIVKQMRRDKTLLVCAITIALIRGGIIGSLAVYLLSPILDLQGYTMEWMFENLAVFGVCYVVILITMGVYVRINYPNRTKS
jgi:hypothetical protein